MTSATEHINVTPVGNYTLLSPMTTDSTNFSSPFQTDDNVTNFPVSYGWHIIQNTTTQPSPDMQSTSAGANDSVLPVIGLPGPMFTVIHSAALFSLTTTIVISVALLVWLCACRKATEHHANHFPSAEKKGGRKYASEGSTASTDFSSKGVTPGTTSTEGSTGTASAADKRLGRNGVT